MKPWRHPCRYELGLKVRFTGRLRDTLPSLKQKDEISFQFGSLTFWRLGHVRMAVLIAAASVHRAKLHSSAPEVPDRPLDGFRVIVAETGDETFAGRVKKVGRALGQAGGHFCPPRRPGSISMTDMRFKPKRGE